MLVSMATPDVQLREMVERMMARLNTCLPGRIEAFDPLTQLVDVTPCCSLRGFDGTVTEFPKLIRAPLIFPQAGGFALTLPVQAGDPCLILFGQRSIEAWVERGGVPPPDPAPIPRHHDLTDALVLLAPSPLPDVWSSWNTNGIELRNRDASTRVSVEEAAVDVRVGSVRMLVDASGVTITGDLVVSGNVSDAKGSMEEMRTTYNSHDHKENGGVGPTNPPNQPME